MFKTVLLMIVCGAIGFIGARALHVPAKSIEALAPQSDLYREKYENLQKQIRKIHDVDFEEYLSLKEQKAKYEKADEILGKIFVLFLAEAGLKLANQKEAPLKPQESTTKQAAAEIPEEPCKPAKAAGALGTKDDIAWVKHEKIVGPGKLSEDDTKNVVIQDLFSVLKNAKPIGLETGVKISGNYAGTIQFEGPPFLWMMNLELEVTGENDNGVIEGKSKLSLAEPNKEPFSSSGSDGNQDQFMAPDNGSQAILLKVKAKNKDNYLQLYPTDNNRKLIGNYYESVSLDQFKKTGTVSLMKR
jgi:hypothetical protein